MRWSRICSRWVSPGRVVEEGDLSLDTAVIARSVVTVVWFVTFVGLCLWAWSARRRDDFSAAARLPFDDDATVETAAIKPETGATAPRPAGRP